MLLREYPTLAPKLHNIYLAMTARVGAGQGQGQGRGQGGNGQEQGQGQGHGGRLNGKGSAADRTLEKGMNWYLAMRESGTLHDQEGLLRFSKVVGKVYGVD